MRGLHPLHVLLAAVEQIKSGVHSTNGSIAVITKTQYMY